MGIPTPLFPVYGVQDARIAAAYNDAGERYLAYADGALEDLFCFDGEYAYGDRQSWALIAAKLEVLRAAGRRSLSVLDLGCGPGTWLKRVIIQARKLGFTTITARGVDLADAQIAHARKAAAPLMLLPGVDLKFSAGDIRSALTDEDGSIDICLCLYGVLNHLSPADAEGVLRQVARISRGWFIATVRAVGSMPTIYVDHVREARSFRQDNRNDRLDVELANGRRISMHSHLFSATELRDIVARHMAVEDLRGLDLFHQRFALDGRFNPVDRLDPGHLLPELDRLEEVWCHHPGMMDFATHLLLIASSWGQA